MISFDHLDSTRFEELVYDILHDMGYFNINRRKGTGYNASPADQGRDIECTYTYTNLYGKVIDCKMYIECKKHKKGVSVEKIQNATAYALSHRPDDLLIVCANALSNSAKEYIDWFRENNRPYTRIDYRENKNLENHLSRFPNLLKKYNLFIS